MLIIGLSSKLLVIVTKTDIMGLSNGIFYHLIGGV